MSILTDSYNLAMEQYRNMIQFDRAERINGSNVNNVNTNISSETNSFSQKVESAVNTNSSFTYAIKPSNNSSVNYSSTVKALSDSKVQKIIKKHNIDEIVSLAAKKYDLPESLIYKVIETESYFDINCKSSAGACGLMQLMPETALEEGVTNIFDPYQNIMGGCSELRKHINRFDGDLRLALAAYNAGPGNVIKYGGVPPFKETQNYVKKILGF